MLINKKAPTVDDCIYATNLYGSGFSMRLIDIDAPYRSMEWYDILVQLMLAGF